MPGELVTKNDQVTVAFTADRIQLIKDTYFKGSSDDEFRVFISVCQRRNLDPFTRQIYPVKRWDGVQRREVRLATTRE
jgi:hypothetical protein